MNLNFYYYYYYYYSRRKSLLQFQKDHCSWWKILKIHIMSPCKIVQMLVSTCWLKNKKINVHKWESLFKNAYILFIAVYIFFMCN